jgi:hypothetical protein
MIRKILVVTAAFAMPVAALTAVTTVASSGVAFAKGGPPEAMTCAQTGSVTFAKPGLTYGGTLTGKATTETKAVVAGTGDALPCGTKAIKLKIISPTTACSAPSPAPACSGATVKDPNYYDSAAGFTGGSTLTDLATALAAGIKTTDNGTKVTLEFGSDSVSSSCLGAGTLGFEIQGNVNDAAGPTGLTYTDNVCLTTDTGISTTGNFTADLTADESAAVSTIKTAGIGGVSSLVVS